MGEQESATYEEIRRAVIRCLLEDRAQTNRDMETFYGLRLAAGRKLYAGNRQLSNSGLSDREERLFREVFWDLFREGIITLGRAGSNDSFPAYSLTLHAQERLADDTEYFFRDYGEYEARIRKQVPNVDPVTLVYLKEALQAYRSGCLLSASVMLGVAAEHVFNTLVEATEGHPRFHGLFKSVRNERRMLRKVEKFGHKVRGDERTFPWELREDFDTDLMGVQATIRQFRNEAGHPTGKLPRRDSVFMHLQLVIRYLEKAFGFISFFREGNGEPESETRLEEAGDQE